MKIKIIKKINAFFLALLLFVGVGFMSVAFWSSWENLQAKKASIVGKASRVGLVSDVNDSDIVLTDAASMRREEEQQKEPFSFAVFGSFPFFENISGINTDTAFFVGNLTEMDLSQVDDKRAEMSKSKERMINSFENFHVVFGKKDVSCGKQCADLWVEELFGFKNSDFGEVLLYHSFDYEDTHFILLSTNYPGENEIDKQQLAWLKEDLKGNENKNVIVMQDSSFGDVYSKEIKDLYMESGVDLVVSSVSEVESFIYEEQDVIKELKIGNKKQAYVFSVEKEDIFLEVIDSQKQLIKKIKIK